MIMRKEPPSNLWARSRSVLGSVRSQRTIASKAMFTRAYLYRIHVCNTGIAYRYARVNIVQVQRDVRQAKTWQFSAWKSGTVMLYGLVCSGGPKLEIGPD